MTQGILFVALENENDVHLRQIQSLPPKVLSNEDDCFHFDCTQEEEKAAIHMEGQWWLRSPGYKANEVAKIFYNGEISSEYVYTTGIEIRPAMWIKY